MCNQARKLPAYRALPHASYFKKTTCCGTWPQVESTYYIYLRRVDAHAATTTENEKRYNACRFDTNVQCAPHHN